LVRAQQEERTIGRIGNLNEVTIGKPDKGSHSRPVLIEPALETIDESDRKYEGPTDTPTIIEDVRPHRRRIQVVAKLFGGKVRCHHRSGGGRDRRGK
jgi:hypothetical protein